MKLSIIIPVYNEKNTILEILKRIENVNIENLGFEKEIIIVDDNSNDGSREILKKLKGNYKVIYHSKNKGKGACIKTGLKKVTGEYVLIQDADLEYDPNDYIKILECALKNKAEVVYGSRILNSKNKYSSFLYYLGGRLITFFTNLLYGIKITDESTGYKLFKTTLLKSINLESDGFEFCPEVTSKIAKRKIKIYEVPINYNPRTRKEGKKIRWVDGLKAILTLLKYKFEKQFLLTLATSFFMSLILIFFFFLIFKNSSDPFFRWNEDNNALYGLSAYNWLRFGILKLKLGMVGYWLENLKEKISFYTHHPSFFILPTYIIYKIFGISEFATRLSPIVFSFFSTLIFFSLVSLESKNNFLSLFSAFLFSTLPTLTFYGKMLDHEIFVLFFVLLSLYWFLKLKATGKKLFLFLFLITIFLGNFSGWHFYFLPVILWFIILFEINFPERKTLLFSIIFLEMLAFSLNLFHVYLLGGKEALFDLKNAFFVRTQGLPFSFWISRIWFCLKINFTLSIVILGIIWIPIILFELIRERKMKLAHYFFLFPFLITISFRQWVTHPYGVFYFLPYFSLIGGKAFLFLTEKIGKKIKNNFFSFLVIFLLLSGQFYLNLRALSFFDKNLILDKESIDFLKEIKEKVNPKRLCLGREQTGIGYHAIFSFYLRVPLSSSPECINKIPFSIIFRPSSKDEFLIKEVNLFLENNYTPIECRGVICLLKK